MWSKMFVFLYSLIQLVIVINGQINKVFKETKSIFRVPDYELCLKYNNLEVLVTFPLGDYQVLIADMQRPKTPESIVEADDKRVAFRVYRHPRSWKDDSEQMIDYFETKRLPIVNEIDQMDKTLGPISYVFATTHMRPVFQKVWGHKNDQRMTQIHYFVFTEEKSERRVKRERILHFTVVAFEFDYVSPAEDWEPTFNVLNWEKVFDSRTPNTDKTGYLNLKHFMAYFPDGVVIKSIAMLEHRKKDEGLGVLSPQYFAIVYTREWTNQDNPFYARHYLKGVEHVFQSPDNRKTKLHWKFDYTNHSSINEDRDQSVSCTELDSLRYCASLTYVTNVRPFGDKQIIKYYLLEFIEGMKTSHVRTYVDIELDGEGTPDYKYRIHKQNNTIFLACELNFQTKPVPKSDCRKDKSYDIFKRDRRIDEELPIDGDSPDDEVEEESASISTILLLLLIVIAIIGLVSYEISAQLSRQSDD